MSSEVTAVHHDDVHGEEHSSMTKGRIVKVALILSAITCVEFFIALYLVPFHVWNMTYAIANPVYIVLTLFKAFYIVAYFMHLKFEKTGLIMAIIVPILFIIGLILVLTNESHYWILLRSVLS